MRAKAPLSWLDTRVFAGRLRSTGRNQNLLSIRGKADIAGRRLILSAKRLKTAFVGILL
jgi:hypothetical protein